MFKWDIVIALPNNFINWNRVWLAYLLMASARFIVGGKMFIIPLIPDNYHLELVRNSDEDEDIPAVDTEWGM